MDRGGSVVTDASGDPEVTGPRLLRAGASPSESSAIVSASSFLTALLGAAQALLIALIVGEDNRTDAFLASYALYTVFTIFASSLRSSVVPVLGAPGAERAFRARATEVLSRVLGIAALAFVGMSVLAPVVGQLVTNGLPTDARWTAVLGLLVLAPSAFCQIHAAALSAMLAAAHRFAFSAALYVAAGALGLACSAILLDLVGVLGAGLGVLSGSILLAAAHSLYVRRFDIRPHLRLSSLGERVQSRLTAILLAGAAVGIALQASLAISLAAVSSDPGAITAYTYAFFIVGLLLTIGAPSLALATMPALVGRIARGERDAAERHLLTVVPYSLAVLAPLLLVYLAYGKPALEAVFGDSLTGDTVSLLYDVGIPLAVMAVPTASVYLTAAVTLAVGRSRRLIPVGAAGVLAHAAIVLPVSALGPEVVAAGHAASAGVMAALLLAATFGHGWPGLALGALRRSIPAFLLAAVALLPRLALGSDPDLGPAIAGAVVSLLVYAGLVLALWPSVGRTFLSLVRGVGAGVEWRARLR